MKWIAATALVLAATAAHAQDGPRNMTSISGLKGTCDQLVTPDVTVAPCHWAIMSMTYDDGRTSFAFFNTGDGPDAVLASFSGSRDQETVDGSGIRTRPIDLVVTGHSVSDMHSLPARGTCTFGDATKGVAKIHCEATTDVGTFSGDFTSDGNPPEVTQVQ